MMRLQALPAVALLALVAVGCGGKQYELKGDIRILNDCLGGRDAIPATVDIASTLSEPGPPPPGASKLGRDMGVALTPDPAADPLDPVKIGSYSIKVDWDEWDDPTEWSRPRVLVNDEDVCLSIACEGEGNFCRDRTTATNVAIEAWHNGVTPHDIRVGCACGGN